MCCVARPLVKPRPATRREGGRRVWKMCPVFHSKLHAWLRLFPATPPSLCWFWDFPACAPAGFLQVREPRVNWCSAVRLWSSVTNKELLLKRAWLMCTGRSQHVRSSGDCTVDILGTSHSCWKHLLVNVFVVCLHCLFPFGVKESLWVMESSP